MPRKYKRYLFEDHELPPVTRWRRRRRYLAASLNEPNEELLQLSPETEFQNPNPEPPNTLDETIDASSGDESTGSHNDLQMGVDPSLESAGDSDSNVDTDQGSTGLPSPSASAIGDVSDQDSDSSSDNENIGDLADHEADQIRENADILPNVDVENPMCPCAKVTADDVVVMVLSLGLRHNLSWVAQVDILSLINTFYDEDKLPSSKYLYLKKIEKKDTKINYHLFCNACELYLGEKSSFTDNIVACEHCHHSFDKRKVQSFFVTLSLEDQLKEILKDKKIAQSLLTHRFDRAKYNPDNIEDIYDGECYKKLFDNGGPLSNPHNFSYSFNTDGMPIGKSSRKTLWPIYVTISELPHCDRDKYVLLAGLYIGNKDPDQSMYLEPFVEQANRLSSTGFSWELEGKMISSLFIPLCAVVDSVARYQMLNMSSYVSYYGCTFCYIPNEYTRRGVRFTIPKERCEERTQESTINDIGEAHNRCGETTDVRKRRYRGVKGPSPLMWLNYFNIILGFVPDYMHSILQGVIKTHMELLFESTRKKFWIGMNDRISMDHVISAIDERLLCIAPPKAVTRIPRSMVERAQWKASEWRAWILFYCIPCLLGILQRKYLNHLALLCTATSILLGHSISEASLREAEFLLLRYVFFFEKYFKKENMVYNVHLLTHIGKGVRNWGPLWTHNCFLYEGQNRYILQMYQSPNQVLKQLVRKFLTFGSLPSLVTKTSTTERGVEFCESILNKKLKYFLNVGGVTLLRKLRAYTLSEEERQIIASNDLLNENFIELYDAMIFKNCRFTTSKFAEGKKSNNSFVLLQEKRFGQIACILRDCEQNTVNLIVRLVKTSRNPVPIDENLPGKFTPIFQVRKTKKLILTAPRAILDVCVHIDLSCGTYICPVPYGSCGNF